MYAGWHFVKSLVITTSALFAVCVLAVASRAGSPAAGAKLFAQKLVEATHAKHPEATEIGISARSRSGCRTIASTDPGDIGEKCEKDDATPMDTGKPTVEKEKDGFDISVPLHDVAGKIVGSVGIEFKPEPRQTESAVLTKAKKIAAEMETQISSKAKLYERVE